MDKPTVNQIAIIVVFTLAVVVVIATLAHYGVWD